jgi:hypothetical protein
MYFYLYIINYVACMKDEKDEKDEFLCEKMMIMK